MSDGRVLFLRTEGLAVGYDGDPLIRGIDLELRCGEIVSLIGPNGAGKSTILKTLTKYLEPIAGTVYIEGRELGEVPSEELAKEQSVMLTDRPTTELLTCEDVVEAGRYPYTGRLGILEESDHEKVRGAMELVNVWGLRDRDFMQVSDGQRQRILLARAICQEPRVLVLDEPSNYLDIHYQIELLHVLKRFVASREVTIIMSMHELALARNISDRVICVKGSSIFASGTVGEIFTNEVIDALYDLVPGSYDAKTGAIDLGALERRADGGQALGERREL